MDLSGAFAGEIFVMGDDNQGDPLFFIEAEKKFFDLVASLGVEIAGGLVGEDDLGIVDNGAGDTDALFLATGKIFGFAFDSIF